VGGDGTVGTISASGVYTPPARLPSAATITVTAVSVADATRSAAATVTLRDPSAAPTISISPTLATVAASGGNQTFTAVIAGGPGSSVTWLVNGAVGGNPQVGTISAAGVYTAPGTVPPGGSVTVTAASTADPTVSAGATVTIVAPAIGAPIISGVPAPTVLAGHSYRFQPAASTSGTGALTFSVTNKPSWATFDPKTGALAGTPASTDQGTYSNIVIAVSDGTTSASLPAFAITVQPGTTGSVTLSWVAPTVRTDGTPLTNLAGFRVYYGTASGVYPNAISVPNPGLSTYVVSNLPSGTYYFVATAYDASGAESAYSGMASKTIN